jgi:hypothetical protein
LTRIAAVLVKEDYEERFAAVQAKLEGLRQIRLDADKALALAYTKRDRAFLAEYFNKSTAVIDTAVNAWRRIARESAGSDATLRDLAQIRDFSWSMQDIAERERLQVAQSIATQTPMQEQMQKENNAKRVQINQLYQILGQMKA